MISCVQVAVDLSHGCDCGVNRYKQVLRRVGSMPLSIVSPFPHLWYNISCIDVPTIRLACLPPLYIAQPRSLHPPSHPHHSKLRARTPLPSPSEALRPLPPPSSHLLRLLRLLNIQHHIGRQRLRVAVKHPNPGNIYIPTKLGLMLREEVAVGASICRAWETR